MPTSRPAGALICRTKLSNLGLADIQPEFRGLSFREHCAVTSIVLKINNPNLATLGEPWGNKSSGRIKMTLVMPAAVADIGCVVWHLPFRTSPQKGSCRHPLSPVFCISTGWGCDYNSGSSAAVALEVGGLTGKAMQLQRVPYLERACPQPPKPRQARRSNLSAISEDLFIHQRGGSNTSLMP